MSKADRIPCPGSRVYVEGCVDTDFLCGREGVVATTIDMTSFCDGWPGFVIHSLVDSTVSILVMLTALGESL